MSRLRFLAAAVLALAGLVRWCGWEQGPFLWLGSLLGLFSCEPSGALMLLDAVAEFLLPLATAALCVVGSVVRLTARPRVALALQLALGAQLAAFVVQAFGGLMAHRLMWVERWNAPPRDPAPDFDGYVTHLAWALFCVLPVLVLTSRKEGGVRWGMALSTAGACLAACAATVLFVQVRGY
jgi:hypothetical protein